MAEAFEVVHGDGFAEIRLLRTLALPDALEMMDEIARTDSGDRRLWDLTEHFDFTIEEIRMIADRGRRNWPGPARVAFLARDDLSFGLARMLEVYRQEAAYRIEVFRDREAAVAWLQVREDGPPS